MATIWPQIEKFFYFALFDHPLKSIDSQFFVFPRFIIIYYNSQQEVTSFAKSLYSNQEIFTQSTISFVCRKLQVVQETLSSSNRIC